MNGQNNSCNSKLVLNTPNTTENRINKQNSLHLSVGTAICTIQCAPWCACPFPAMLNRISGL